jgi:DNA-binding NarL/FixJ family response regulator
MASADIARQLRLSVRTVNNQLQTVFSKLDVHSRRELAGAMAPVPAGLPPLPGQRRARP